ncbi:MAG: helix-turn-helix domain-containing protein [Roseburia sp.]
MKNDSSIDRIIQVNDLCIGNNIRHLRESKKIKQTDMVKKLQLLGVDISTFSYNRIEKGTQNPTVSFLLACCTIFECDANALFRF